MTFLTRYVVALWSTLPVLAITLGLTAYAVASIYLLSHGHVVMGVCSSLLLIWNVCALSELPDDDRENEWS